MSSRMRVTKGHSNNRRAHHALTAARLSVCSSCGANHERHKVCLECGTYRGNKVMEVKTKKNLVEKPEEVKSEAKTTTKKAPAKKTSDKKPAKKTAKKTTKKADKKD